MPRWPKRISRPALAAGATLPVTTTLYVPPIARPCLPNPAALGAAIAADLATLGLHITVKSPDWQTVWLPDVHSGRADLFLLGWTGISGDPDSFLCPYFCGAEGAFNGGQGSLPAPPDDELAALLAQALQTTDPAARKSPVQAGSGAAGRDGAGRAAGLPADQLGLPHRH